MSTPEIVIPSMPHSFNIFIYLCYVNPCQVQNFGEPVLSLPPALLPDSLPWVVTTAFPKVCLKLVIMKYYEDNETHLKALLKD